jgi:DNA-directed RNA polymerase specialized sigma24 family protein
MQFRPFETTTKSKWTLTPESFEKLLESFSTNRDEAGKQYELIRYKLIRFFEWRAIDAATDYADETINRVARRISEGQVIENLKSYFYGVARLVFLEALKERERTPQAEENAGVTPGYEIPSETPADVRLECFEKCLDGLSSPNRHLILDYYREERRTKIELRQQLANELQIPLNALRIRAHRIRLSLERCITSCVAARA